MRIALAQLSSGIDPAENARLLTSHIAEAAAGGATMVFTPEMSGLLDRDRSRAAKVIRNEADDVVLSTIQAEARNADKIHLFDVDLGPDESLRESSAYAGGHNAIVAAIPGATLGLSICYDLRFPGLYEALTDAGADILSIPAAFTVPTGRAHWEILLRARAIEAGAFVIAAAQYGLIWGKWWRCGRVSPLLPIANGSNHR